MSPEIAHLKEVLTSAMLVASMVINLLSIGLVVAWEIKDARR